MSIINQIKIGDTTYDLVDTYVRDRGANKFFRYADRISFGSDLTKTNLSANEHSYSNFINFDDSVSNSSLNCICCILPRFWHFAAGNTAVMQMSYCVSENSSVGTWLSRTNFLSMYSSHYRTCLASGGTAFWLPPAEGSSVSDLPGKYLVLDMFAWGVGNTISVDSFFIYFFSNYPLTKRDATNSVPGLVSFDLE